MKNTAHLLIVALLSSFITIALFKTFDNPGKIIIRERVPTYSASIDDDLLSGIKQRTFVSSTPTDFISAADRSKPAVVYIRSYEPEKKKYWNHNVTASSGSGVVISPNGFIVTNHHVVEGGAEINITLDDKREYIATLVGADPTTDIALLKIEAENLPFMEFGNSDLMQVGEWVLAIGNPFRLESTVTAGIVSAKARNISILDSEASVESFIQTDAVVNQGNSGGALVNTNGELIGINAAIITQSGKYEGYSFAIPSNLAQKVVSDLRAFGEVRRGLLGVKIRNINSEIAVQLGMEKVQGVFVDYVNPSSGAKDAGIEKGDVIVGIDGVPINTFPELQELVARYHPGDEIEITYLRDNREFTTGVVLQQKIIRRLNPKMIEVGFELKDLAATEIAKYGKSGAVVNSIYKDSKIMATNMKAGFIITSVNGLKVNDVDAALEAIDQDEKEIIELGGFYPQFDGEYFYAFRQ